jgi:hypothetical protein
MTIANALLEMSGPCRPNVLTEAARLLEGSEWRVFADEKPTNYTRVIVHRVIGDKSYVDVINYIEEPASGMKPLVHTQHVKHWMPMPEPPAYLQELP